FGPFTHGASVTIDGDISVISRAINDADGEARSKAAADLNVPNGSVASSIHIGNALVDALASERGAGLASASALADLKAQPGLEFAQSGVGDITIGSLVDRASAVSLGGGKAAALSDATLRASGNLQVAGPISALANADDPGPGNFTVTASALLTLSALNNV